MEPRFFRDFHGSTAMIEEIGGEFPYRVCVSAAKGYRLLDRTYQTYEGARAAMCGVGDYWMEHDGNRGDVEVRRVGKDGRHGVLE